MRQPAAPAYRAGILALVAIVIGTFFAFSRGLPFRDHYEIKAAFRTANNVKVHQPVRIAGVEVGEVTKIEHPQPGREMAIVTMRIRDEGRPIREDAEVKIRPRLFLEGNWFLDVQPGTDSAGELDDGDTIPVQQTATPVQLGQVLSILRTDTRQNLRTIFREYASALEGKGADGYRRSIRYWEPAYRNSAIVQEATRGLREHDLSDYIDGAGRVARGLDRHSAQLKSLVTDFNTAAGAFAREAAPLEQAIGELPRTLRAGRPALRQLNDAFPSLRRFAIELRPSRNGRNST
jgi:phospholipid/cholesterol/gamma-HCH transport system substrate-binding protein